MAPTHAARSITLVNSIPVTGWILCPLPDRGDHWSGALRGDERGSSIRAGPVPTPGTDREPPRPVVSRLPAEPSRPPPACGRGAADAPGARSDRPRLPALRGADSGLAAG